MFLTRSRFKGLTRRNGGAEAPRSCRDCASTAWPQSGPGSSPLRRALRVALARAVVTEPDLLILDEPLAAFDAHGCEEAWDEIHRLRGELTVTTLFLTRVVPEAIAHADRLAVMDLGRILQVGSPAELVQSPDRRLRRAVPGANQPAARADRRVGQRITPGGGGPNAAGTVGRQDRRSALCAPFGNARDPFDPARDPVAGPILFRPNGTGSRQRSSGSSSAATSASSNCAGPATGRSPFACSRTSLPASARARA